MTALIAYKAFSNEPEEIHEWIPDSKRDKNVACDHLSGVIKAGDYKYLARVLIREPKRRKTLDGKSKYNLGKMYSGDMKITKLVAMPEPAIEYCAAMSFLYFNNFVPSCPSEVKSFIWYLLTQSKQKEGFVSRSYDKYGEYSIFELKEYAIKALEKSHSLIMSSAQQRAEVMTFLETPTYYPIRKIMHYLYSFLERSRQVLTDKQTTILNSALIADLAKHIGLSEPNQFKRMTCISPSARREFELYPYGGEPAGKIFLEFLRLGRMRDGIEFLTDWSIWARQKPVLAVTSTVIKALNLNLNL